MGAHGAQKNKRIVQPGQIAENFDKEGGKQSLKESGKTKDVQPWQIAENHTVKSRNQVINMKKADIKSEWSIQGKDNYYEEEFCITFR